MRSALCILALLTSSLLFSQPALWGNLEKGKYEVGFRSIYTYDLARPSIVDQEISGLISSPTPPAPGRQMQITVWYPASTKGKTMHYSDYVYELGRELDFSALTDERKSKAVAKLAGMYGESREFKKEELNKILPLEMAAFRDAKPASGKFPVLIFPQWFSPVQGSIMSEYLASQGFVIASTSLKGTDSTMPEITPRGLLTQANDIAFIINELGALPFVDISRIALMGVGINATGCVTLMRDNSVIDAFISLEGGIITSGEQQMLQQTGLLSQTGLAIPMLFINAPHPSVQPELANYFKYADKYFLRFNHMSEYYFLNNGMLESFIPGIIGKPPGDVKAGFEWGARYVNQFLKFKLLDDSKAKAYMESLPSDHGIQGDFVEASFKPGLTVPPDLQALKTLAAKSGASSIRTTYDQLKTVDLQPFTQQVLDDLFNWLRFGRDKDYVIRSEVARIWLESYPNSARGSFSMARVLTLTNQKEQAKSYYKKALEYLPGDNDIYLSPVVRERIRLVSEEELGKP